MVKEMQWAGTCRGSIISYELGGSSSKAVPINVVARIDEYWDLAEQAWKDCRSHEFEVGGALWVIKKDGSLNANQIEALAQHAGWDGDLTSIVHETWKPTPCAFTVQEDNYKDEARFRIAWLNDYERVPTAGTISAEKAKALQNQYGSQLRAVVGNIARNSISPPSEGPSPVASPSQSLAEEAKTVEGDDIPF